MKPCCVALAEWNVRQAELQTCVCFSGGSCPMGMGARYSQSAVKLALYRNNLQTVQSCDMTKGLSWFCHWCWQDPARGFTADVSIASLMALLCHGFTRMNMGSSASFSTTSGRARGPRIRTDEHGFKKNTRRREPAPKAGARGLNAGILYS